MKKSWIFKALLLLAFIVLIGTSFQFANQGFSSNTVLADNGNGNMKEKVMKKDKNDNKPEKEKKPKKEKKREKAKKEKPKKDIKWELIYHETFDEPFNEPDEWVEDTYGEDSPYHVGPFDEDG